MLRVHTSDTTIVNYNCKMFIVQALDPTIVNYNCKMFIVQTAGDAPFVTKRNDHESNLFSMATIVVFNFTEKIEINEIKPWAGISNFGPVL